MKHVFIILCALLSTSSAFAGAVVIQSPGSSREAYEGFLKEQPTLESYSRYLISKAESNPRQEEALYHLGENLDTSSKILMQSLQQIEEPLSATSLNFVFDLSNKLTEKTDLRNNSELRILNCKVRGLLTMPLEKCAKIHVDFQAMERQWPFARTLMIESVSFSLSTTTSLDISSEAIYRFTLLSDSYKAISFRGTYLQLMQQHFTGEPLVDGTCSGFSANVDDFNITNSGMIFFNKECVKAANTPPGARNISEWVENNKYWVYPLGALLIGGAAYSLKDKKIVIDKP